MIEQRCHYQHQDDHTIHGLYFVLEAQQQSSQKYYGVTAHSMSSRWQTT